MSVLITIALPTPVLLLRQPSRLYVRMNRASHLPIPPRYSALTAVDSVDMTFGKDPTNPSAHPSEALLNNFGGSTAWAFIIFTKIGPWVFTVPSHQGFRSDGKIPKVLSAYEMASKRIPKAPISTVLICGDFSDMSKVKWKFAKDMVTKILSGAHNPVYFANTNASRKRTSRSEN